MSQIADDSKSRTFRAIERVFLEARDLDAVDREALLDRIEAEDPAVANGARELLRGASAPSRIDALLGGLKDVQDAIRIEDDVAPDVSDGSLTIGRYKLLERIGEGGFGTVYMAEQTEPVRRKVALKVLKPGMDTRQVIARFEAERQALALMDHPNITRILDAGSTDKGRPFFVMDLVRGVPITDYCEKERLTTDERVRLFIGVCEAIQHAHHKGIIHRDLKPSNVLVTLHDGKPVPKVIDFGIAKAIHGKLTDKTLFTQFRQFIGTPAYMSPEQAEMSGLDVDTRTDIYSLGVLLYELLTSTTPFDKHKLASCSHAEVQRIIREVEPPTPSRRVNSDSASKAPSSSALRRLAYTLDPSLAKTISRELAGDLDWIAMKCIEKDRTRRYSSAADLATDLRNHLEDRPVLAGPPGASYKARRFVRRNRGVLVALAAVFLALVTGMTLAIFAMRDAQHERDAAMAARENAMHEAARAKACVDLVVQMFTAADPAGTKPRQDSVKRLLDDFTAMRGEQLAAEPDVALTIHTVAGNAYSSLGELEKARYHADAALELARRLHGNRGPETAAALDLVALVELRRGLIPSAEQRLHESLAILRESGPARSDALAETLQNLAKAKRLGSDFEAASKYAEESLEMLRGLHGERHETVASAHYVLAMVRAEQGRLDDAESEVQLAHDLYVATLRPDHPYVAMALSELANVASLRGDLPRARDLHAEALAMRIESLGESHYEVAINKANLALVVRELGDLKQAEDLLRQALATVGEVFGESTPQYASLVGSLGATLFRAGRNDEAEELLRRAVTMHTALAGRRSLQTATQLGNLAILLMTRGELDESEQISREVLAIRREHYGPSHQATAIALNNLAEVLERQGRYEEAITVLDDSLRAISSGIGEAHPLFAATKIAQADLLIRAGKTEAAEANLRTGIAALRRVPNPPAALADALEMLAQQRIDGEDFEEALRLLDESLVARAKLASESHWRSERSRSLRGLVYTRLHRHDEALADLAAAERSLAEDASAPRSEHQRTVERLVVLYEDWGRPEDAATWRASLEGP